LVKTFLLSSEQDFLKVKNGLEILGWSISRCLGFILDFSTDSLYKDQVAQLIDESRLYKIDQPIIVNTSDYGVPQNRERVLFIGCSSDQEMITRTPSTVAGDEKVTVRESLHDLDFIGINDTVACYQSIGITSSDLPQGSRIEISLLVTIDVVQVLKRTD